MKKYIIGVAFLLVTLGWATLALAQDSSRKNEGMTAQGQAGDTKFEVQVQKKDQGGGDTQGPQGEKGPTGAPGPQGAPGPAAPSGGTTIVGMDPTIALLVGLGVLAVVIVAIVAASRRNA